MERFQLYEMVGLFKKKKGRGFQKLTSKIFFQVVYNEFAFLKEIQIESGIFHIH